MKVSFRLTKDGEQVVSSIAKEGVRLQDLTAELTAAKNETLTKLAQLEASLPPPPKNKKQEKEDDELEG